MGRDTLDHKVVWTHTLVPKTDTDGGITVTEEENQSSSVTPPTVQGPGEKTGEVKQMEKSRRKNKFGSAARAVPPTVQGPGEKTREMQMERSRRKNKFGSAARAVPPTEVVGSSSDTPPTVQGPGEVKQMEKRKRSLVLQLEQLRPQSCSQLNRVCSMQPHPQEGHREEVLSWRWRISHHSRVCSQKPLL